MALATGDRIRIIVCGDSGVGKTALTHLISNGEPIENQSSTIGCAVEVKIHDYKEGTPQEKSFFIELCDIGGAACYKNSRHIFYQPVHGCILVHDLTNKKSRQNLRNWLNEVLKIRTYKSRAPEFFQSANSPGQGDHVDDFGWKPPVLVVGTKYDLAQWTMQQEGLPTYRVADIAAEYGADELFVDCQKVASVSPGSTNAVKFSKYFDKCIDYMFIQKGIQGYSSNPGGNVDKRKSKAATSARGSVQRTAFKM